MCYPLCGIVQEAGLFSLLLFFWTLQLHNCSPSASLHAGSIPSNLFSLPEPDSQKIGVAPTVAIHSTQPSNWKKVPQNLYLSFKMQLHS